MIEPRPRKAVQNLKTFQAIAGPDLCITRKNNRKNSPDSFSKPKRLRFRRRLPTEPSSWSGRDGESAGLRQFWGKNKKWTTERKTENENESQWRIQRFSCCFQCFAFPETANLRTRGSNLAFRFLGILTQEKMGMGSGFHGEKLKFYFFFFFGYCFFNFSSCFFYFNFYLYFSLIRVGGCITLLMKWNKKGQLLGHSLRSNIVLHLYIER